MIHFDSGFGNQISIYAEYLAMKYANPHDTIYMEDIVYSIPETEEFLAMWQGYELEKVFGIKIPNISQLFEPDEYSQIIDEVRESRFWDNDWNYPPVITGVLEKHGIQLKNICRSNFIPDGGIMKDALIKVARKVRKTKLGGSIIRGGMKAVEKRIITKIDYKNKMFIKTDENLFFGQTGYPLFRNAGLELIEGKLRGNLKFRPKLSQKNIEILDKIDSCNSVAIHARRGDMMTYVDFCYTNGYFKRAADFIRKKTKDPHFFVFSDDKSGSWIQENKSVLGIRNEDPYNIIDWNTGNDSYVDMFLMSRCKHNVFTRSSFGFWAAWLNENPQKITCSPDIRINSKYHF